MVPINNNLERFVPEFRFKEKPRVKISAIRTWTKSIEIKLLSHELKNHAVELLIKHRKAKGLIIINICNITYRKEYVKSKLIRPKLVKDFIIPSKENSEKPESFKYTEEFIWFIIQEKEISFPKVDFPRILIRSVIIETISIIWLQIQREEFIRAIKIIHLNINWLGCSLLA